MQKTLKLLFTSSRPISWVNTAFPFAAGYLVSGGALNAQFFIGTLFFLIPYNLLMYGVNDVFDYESDMRNPRKGGIEGAVTPIKYHKVILWTATLLSAPFVIALIILGTPLSSLALVAVLFFVVAYSAKYLRFKERPLLDSITSSLHFVGPLIYALVLTNSLHFALPIVIAFFLWGMASHAFGAVQDIIPDRKAKISSIATVFGARATVWFAFLCYAAAIALCVTQGTYAAIVALASCAYIASVIPYLSVTDKTSASTRAGWKRFLWINYAVGAVVTICLILATLN